MTYNHEEAKALCPAAAKEVERLREELERLRDSEPVRCISVEAIREATGCQDFIGRNGESLVEEIAAKFKAYANP